MVSMSRSRVNDASLSFVSIFLYIKKTERMIKAIIKEQTICTDSR